MSSEDESKKLIIAGLPGSGLRTIKAVVVDNTPPKEFKEVIQKLEIGNAFRDVLQNKVLLLRCGGEKSIQDILSADKDPIYKDVEGLLFVLDANDQSTFSIAKYWFDNLVGHLHKFSPDARIFLLLNKIDLLSDMNNIAEYVQATKSLFAVPGYDIYIHETSIYDASIFFAFKDVMRKEIDEQISIKQYLNRVITGSSFIGMAVYSMDGLAIYDAGELTTVVEISANLLLSTISRITEELEPDDEISSTILQMKKNYFMVFKAIDKNCIFVGLSKRRPKLGQFLIETDQIVDMLRKAV